MVANFYNIPPGFRRIPERVNLAEEVLRHGKDPNARNRVALIYDRGSVSYADLFDRVRRFAGAAEAKGIAPGDKVLLRLYNSPEFAIAFLGLAWMGALPVLQNSLATESEVSYVIDACQPVSAVTLHDIGAPLRAQASRFPNGLIVARGKEGGESALEEMVSYAEPGPAASTRSSEPAFMVYTSGTTGKPKGIVHAHRWIVALGDSNRLRLPPDEDDIVLHTGEWSFIAALGQHLLFPLRNGVRVAILEGRALPERVAEAVGRYRVTLLFSVATVYRKLLAMEDLERKYDLSTLRGCNSTGEPLEKATYEEWKRRVGCDIWEHYGVSEMQMVLGQGPLVPLRPGSIGVPLPGSRIAILDDNYEAVPPGNVGNLLIGADDPGFFLGYYNNPELTAHVMRNGWYHTGDLARQDEDGYIWIAGRSDDCFKSRGIFISPVEIENALREHPIVSEACVVPIPDKEIGNRIRAVIVPRGQFSGEARLVEELREWLKGRIAPYKIPHAIELVDELPKSPVGKVLRRELRARQA